MLTKNVDLTAKQVKAGPQDGLAEGEFTAYASVFGNRDSYGDVVVKGAFAEDLQRWADTGNPIPLLFGHNLADPDFNIGHVIEAAEDDHGLLVKAQLDLENPKALQVYRMLKGRRINQMSFAYDVLDGGPAQHDGDDVYELRKLHVYEVSVVSIGANQETEILTVKSAAGALAAGLKAGRVLSAKNESSLRDARDSIDSVLSSLDGEDGKAADAADDQVKASGTPEANADAAAEESPSGTNAAVPAEEPKAGPSVEDLAALIRIKQLEGSTS